MKTKQTKRWAFSGVSWFSVVEGRLTFYWNKRSRPVWLLVWCCRLCFSLTNLGIYSRMSYILNSVKSTQLSVMDCQLGHLILVAMLCPVPIDSPFHHCCYKQCHPLEMVVSTLEMVSLDEMSQLMIHDTSHCCIGAWWLSFVHLQHQFSTWDLQFNSGPVHTWSSN